MRTFSIVNGRLAATLWLALMAAGCDRLASVTTMTSASPDPTRYAVVKDTTGRTVRLDKITGDVAPVDTTTAPATVERPAAGRGTVRRSPRASRPTHVARELPASLIAITPARVVTPQPVVAVRPDPARISVDELCADHDDIFAVTLMDAPVFAQPAIGTPLVTRVSGGTLVTMTGDSGEWLYVTFEGRRGPVSGFVHCSTLRVMMPATGGPIDDTEPTGEF